MHKNFLFMLLNIFCWVSSDAEISEPGESDLKFLFYSVASPLNGIQINISDPKSVNRTSFNPKKENFFCVHGWHESVRSKPCVSLKDIYFEKHDVNVFIVDWIGDAEDFYPAAVAKMEILGDELGSWIKTFEKYGGLNLDTTTLVGYSIGAHLAGVAGTALGGRVQVIVGLDPAGIGFSPENKMRLSTSSAKFVHVIHTNRGGLGYYHQIGHADYYPNGGKHQPMCHKFDMSCSHLMALDFYFESLKDGNFKAVKCNSYEDFQNETCKANSVSKMGGYNIDTKAAGKYFLETNTQPPYAKVEEKAHHDYEPFIPFYSFH